VGKRTPILKAGFQSTYDLPGTVALAYDFLADV
jgi:hypothetical protein